MGYVFFLGAFVGYAALDWTSNALIRRVGDLPGRERPSRDGTRTLALKGLVKWAITDVPMSAVAGIALPIKAPVVAALLASLLACRELLSFRERPVFAPVRIGGVLLTGVCSLLAYFLPLMLVAYRMNHAK